MSQENSGKDPVKYAGKEAAASERSAVPSINLPKGGGAIRGIGEKFAANPVTGTGLMSVPIATSPGRSGFGPQLSLSYDSGAGNGPFGFGWHLALPSITRKTDKGLPRYLDAVDSDLFLLSGVEDLVPVYRRDADGTWVAGHAGCTRDQEYHWVYDSSGNMVFQEDVLDGYRVRRYRPRIDGLFARIERWSKIGVPGDVHWRSISRDNILTLYGLDADSRIADPQDNSRIFSWLISVIRDDKGNAVVYRYKAEDGNGVDLTKANERNRERGANRYLKRILYGNRTSLLDDGGRRPRFVSQAQYEAADWMFEVVFDYGEHDAAAPQPSDDPAAGSSVPWPARNDPFSSYRAGFEVRTYRLCQRVLMFHHFPDLPSRARGYDGLVRSTDFEYSYEKEPGNASNPVYSFLLCVTQNGYRFMDGGGYLARSQPPVQFGYTLPVVQDRVEEVGPEFLENIPVGLYGADYQWTDLHGEGIPGILTEQGGNWFYSRNLSSLPVRLADGQEETNAQFAPVEPVDLRPNLALADGAQFMDLAGDGQPDLVLFDGPVPGLYEHDDAQGWRPFRPFTSPINRVMHDPNLRLVDLDGDGRADVLITEDDVFVWHPSLAEEGFGPARRVAQELDEEKGPRLVFADGTESIYLADLSGDSLTDLVRIRNGQVCYWPNLGYGRFGAMVTMDRAPRFDDPDQFDQKRIRLADIDGSGTTDIIYLHRDGVRLYFNQSGNGWSQPQMLKVFPRIDDLASIVPADLLGNGTACLVWSSPLPGDARRPMRYVNLMGGSKPHLLIRSTNNLGAETRIAYAPSTKFYLQDKRAGRPWITRLPFPVHVVERVETYDHISRNRFVTRYAYHHGYFDGVEREFRGFAMVEQWDCEEFGAFSKDGDYAVEEAGQKGNPILTRHLRQGYGGQVVLPLKGRGRWQQGQTHSEASATPSLALKGRGGWLDADNIDPASHLPPAYTKTWYHTGWFLGRDRVSNYFAGLSDGGDAGEYYIPQRTGNAAGAAAAKRLLVDDTILPSGLTLDEEREACRALKGSMLRQEVYALDGSAKQDIPYAVTEQNFTIGFLQPQGDNPYAVFFIHPREALNFHYERNPDDPRIGHAMTLELDDYGNVLKSLSICYGRARGMSPLTSDWDRARQEQPLITYTENDVTNAIDDLTLWPDDHRSPLPAEARTWEITGVQVPPGAIRFCFDDFTGANLQRCANLREIGYEQTADSTEQQKRLIGRQRTLYRADDLGTLLAKGKLEPRATAGEGYKLAFTPGLLRQVYQRNGTDLLPVNPAELLAGGGGDLGGYVDLDGDGNWWVPSGRVFFSPGSDDDPRTELAYARQHFFLLFRFRDPFHTDQWCTETRVTYDGYDLFSTQTVDPVGNVVSALYDYRVLQPQTVTDPNGNRSQAAFDALGLVVAMAVMGKAAPAPAEGDLLEGFDPDPPLASLQQFAADPFGKAAGLLGKATTRTVYDLDRYRRCGEPPFVATLAREIHVADPGGERTRIQVGFSFSDGFAREIQKKVQAEAGDAPQRNANQPTSSGDVAPGAMALKNGQPVMAPANPRWIGTGRTVYNNKGKPVKQYEPFFSSTHLYEPEPDLTDTGVSPVLFYDPLARVVATLHPNHTYEKVVSDPWQQVKFDVNDTVAANGSETGDPRTDPDIAGYVAPYFETQPPGWQTWYQQRIGGELGPDEQNAASRTALHANTPAVAHADTMGRTFLTVEQNRFRFSDAPETDQPREEFYATRRLIDIEGNQREVIDANGRIVMRNDYDMIANRIHQAGMEAGERWMLSDVAGKALRAWNSRLYQFDTQYDVLRRTLRSFVQGGDPSEPEAAVYCQPVLVGRTIYGDSPETGLTPVQQQQANQRGKAFKQYDTGGVVTTDRYDFKGNPLQSSQEVALEYKDVIDWNQPQPNGEAFVTSTTYDALNRPTTLTTQEYSIYRPTYSEANLLDKVEVNLQGAPSVTTFVSNIDHNEKGQRTRIDYGNGVSTIYRYDPVTFRLVHLLTQRNAVRYPDDCPQQPPPGWPGCQVQNVSYTYDPVGNITHIRDDAQQTVFFRNRRVDPGNDYTYDAVYRLIEATGREHLGQAGGQPIPHSYDDAPRVGLPHSGDGNAMARYLERYQYDPVGNFLQFIHRGSDPAHPGWRREYAYREDSLLEPGKFSNRLTSTTMGTTTETYSTSGRGYDAHGNLLRMPQLQAMRWDFRDHLCLSQRQAVNADDSDGKAHQGERTYYVYDAAGQRVRKVTERENGTRMKERIYLGGCEVYREYDGQGNTATLERQTLQVLDDKQRIALVETRTQGSDQSPGQLIRYQFGNYLGSVSLELDDQAKVISYEEYTPYGSTSYQAVDSGIKSAAKRYRYTGMEKDEESGLNYHTARYYAPWLGRWTSTDPSGISGGINLYEYAKSSPCKLVDREGADPPIPNPNDYVVAFGRSAVCYMESAEVNTGLQALNIQDAQSFMYAMRSGRIEAPPRAFPYGDVAMNIFEDTTRPGGLSPMFSGFMTQEALEGTAASTVHFDMRGVDLTPPLRQDSLPGFSPDDFHSSSEARQGFAHLASTGPGERKVSIVIQHEEGITRIIPGSNTVQGDPLPQCLADRVPNIDNNPWTPPTNSSPGGTAPDVAPRPGGGGALGRVASIIGPVLETVGDILAVYGAIEDAEQGDYVGAGLNLASMGSGPAAVLSVAWHLQKAEMMAYGAILRADVDSATMYAGYIEGTVTPDEIVKSHVDLSNWPLQDRQELYDRWMNGE